MDKWQRMKRYIDIVISLFAILMLLPLWFLIAICIFIENPGPIFFQQQRVGKNEKVFTLYKFRSMRCNTIPPLELGAVKHHHPLVTKVGYVLRRFKLDETPQFLNVLFGQMSLIGPRPCLPGRIKSMSTIEKKRFSRLPGLSGWAEVNGNVELTWEEQVMLDLWYIDHWSFWLDCRIFIKTIAVVFSGSKMNVTALSRAKTHVMSSQD